MLFRFEVSASVAQDFKKLVTSSTYLGDTPRTLVSKLIVQAAERMESATPKEPAKKRSAADRKKEEWLAAKEVREAALLTKFRSTGVWPRFNAPTSADHDVDYFNFPVDDQGKHAISAWTPPEDYPHFNEIDIKRGEWARAKELTAAGKPRIEDFKDAEGNIDSDAYEAAELEMAHAELAKYL